MIKLYSPKDELELSFIKSILEGEGIPYFVHNDHFGSLKIGPNIPLFNAKTIMVHEENADQTKELISDFLNNTETDTIDSSSKYTFKDKIRLILECLLFAWVMPGKKWHSKKSEEE
jgi:hypothetical protein